MYGGHGCQPVRQLGRNAPLGSNAEAMVCKMLGSGASKPMLVPKPQPALEEGTTGDEVVTPPTDVLYAEEDEGLALGLTRPATGTDAGHVPYKNGLYDAASQPGVLTLLYTDAAVLPMLL
jgi:hypothetical protein